MKAVVVYESFWGNTASIARAIAEGIGEEALVLATDEASPDVVAGADLLVVGAPLLGFTLPTDGMRKNIAQTTAKGGPEPDLSRPSLRSWLESLPTNGQGRSATFETRLKWSPGSAAKAIELNLSRAGYPALDSERFLVGGTYGPLKDGEVERARAWGAELGRVVSAAETGAGSSAV